HNIKCCKSTKLWDRTTAYCKKNQDNHLVNPQRNQLCFKWQHPDSCFARNHKLHHNMAPKDILEVRKSKVLTPYNPQGWACLLAETG
ncbi:hypothetical protein BDR05DRAFT_860417, partial [Suillus weaverae]